MITGVNYATTLAASQAGLEYGLEVLHDGRQESVREYTIRYRIVPSVDNQGETCAYCQRRTVNANVYVRLMNGDVEVADTCTGCILPVLDGHLDTDPSYIVTVEQPQ
jgi:hypothetical protein